MHKMLCSDKIFLPSHSGQKCFSAQSQAFHADNIFLASKGAGWPLILINFELESGKSLKTKDL